MYSNTPDHPMIVIVAFKIIHCQEEYYTSFYSCIDLSRRDRVNVWGFISVFASVEEKFSCGLLNIENSHS